ncbi:MAG: FkbM family methyltransferase [Verrucomicrobia bacterium]|nr:FkbM family methyltransferase [Verrucomicrobiota bacterium]
MKLSHVLARMFYPYGKSRTVVRGPLKGFKFVVTPGMGVTYAFGSDSINWRFLASCVNPGDVVYDVGGNCGQMALYFSAWSGLAGAVYTFEPAFHNLEILRKNVQLNQMHNVEIVAAAVAADSQSHIFCFDPVCHTMGTLRDAMVRSEAGTTTFEVPCVTLDEFLASGKRPPEVIKIDVEGSGLGVIEGACKLIETHLPKIYFELHAADENARELQAVRMLRDRWGYRLFDLKGIEQKNPAPMWGDALWCVPRNEVKTRTVT